MLSSVTSPFGNCSASLFWGYLQDTKCQESPFPPGSSLTRVQISGFFGLEMVWCPQCSLKIKTEAQEAELQSDSLVTGTLQREPGDLGYESPRAFDIIVVSSLCWTPVTSWDRLVFLIDTNHFFHQGAFFVVVLFCSGDTSPQVLFGSSWPWIGRSPETATSRVLGSYTYTMFLVKTTFKDLYTVHAKHSYLSDIPVCLSLPSNLSLPFVHIHLVCPGYQKIIFILKITFLLM